MTKEPIERIAKRIYTSRSVKDFSDEDVAALEAADFPGKAWHLDIVRMHRETAKEDEIYESVVKTLAENGLSVRRFRFIVERIEKKYFNSPLKIE